MQKLPMTIVVVIAVLALLTAYYWRDTIRFGLIYGWDNVPTHVPLEGCLWERKVFEESYLSFYVQKCSQQNSLSWNYSEDSPGKIIRINNLSSRFTMEIFTKQESQSPMDIVTEWFAKLTPEQQEKCQIQSADVPVEYLPDGTRSSFENPHPTLHKTRYKIDIKPEIVQEIVEKYGGLPDSQQYDYLCGSFVGSPFVATTPYFEFDNRSPDKYLFVGSLGNDGSVLIDLNSIRF